MSAPRRLNSQAIESSEVTARLRARAAAMAERSLRSLSATLSPGVLDPLRHRGRRRQRGPVAPEGVHEVFVDPADVDLRRLERGLEIPRLFRGQQGGVRADPVAGREGSREPLVHVRGPGKADAEELDARPASSRSACRK